MSQFLLHKKVVSSFSQQSGVSAESDGGDYVFELDQSCDGSLIASSMSDNSINVYNTESLRLSGKIHAHTDTINSIEFSKVSPFLLYSAASDKHVCLWDIRTPALAPAIKLRLSEEVTGLSVSMSDSLLAAGVESTIQFYDVRGGSVVQNKKNTKLGEYSDIHSDMITQLKFNPTSPHLLTSASEDGLICVLDTATTEEGDAVVSILNTECPIRRFGFFSGSNEGIFALSTVETASFWHYPSAQRLASFPTIRESLQVEYLVDCVYEPSTDKLCILGGDYSGNCVLAEIDPENCTPIAHFTSGHSATVRCCTVLRNRNCNSMSSGSGSSNALPSVVTLFTGGEDSRVCSWRNAAASAAVNSDNNNNNNAAALGATSIGGQIGTTGGSSATHKSGGSLKQRKSKTNSSEVRHNPY